jgi:hypothetical protein
MLPNYDKKFYRPMYRVQGVPVTFTRASGGNPVSLTAIDRTAGVDVSKPGDLGTIQPAALVYMPDVLAAGLTTSDFRHATLVMNGTTWRVEGHRMRPSPEGENAGEALLILSKTP